MPKRKKQIRGGEVSITRDLMRMGLRATDAALYIYLLGKGPILAQSITDETGLHRVDVYRRLNELARSGLVQIYLENPKRYSAIEPRIAISNLIQKLDSDMKTIQDSVASVEARLEIIRKESSSSKKAKNESFDHALAYRLVFGRAKYTEEIRELIRGAKSEILLLTSANDVQRSFLSGLVKDYLGAKKRGVALRMIASVTPENLPYARRISKIVKLRHLDDLRFRVIVVDCATTIVSTMYNENDLTSKALDDEYLVSNRKSFADAERFVFEHLWNAATPVEKLRGFKKK